MTQKPSKKLHIALWILQILLAGTLAWAGYMKLFTSIDDLSEMWPWVSDAPLLAKSTGFIDLLAATGLIAPLALEIYPQLTAFTAMSVVLLMVSASIFHIARGETSDIGINVVFGMIAAFIAWGRLKTSKEPNPA